MQLLAKWTLDLSHLRENKFKHNFQDTLNAICICDVDTEIFTIFFTLHFMQTKD